MKESVREWSWNTWTVSQHSPWDSPSPSRRQDSIVIETRLSRCNRFIL